MDSLVDFREETMELRFASGILIAALVSAVAAGCVDEGAGSRETSEAPEADASQSAGADAATELDVADGSEQTDAIAAPDARVPDGTTDDDAQADGVGVDEDASGESDTDTSQGDATPGDHCGNGVRDDGEACDGADLGSATCVSLGYASGEVGCGVSCTFDVSGCVSGSAVSGDLVTYVGDGTAVQFNAVVRLSDGTLLVAGGSEGLGWVGADTTVIALDSLETNSAAAGRYGFLARLSADATRLLQVAHFPMGTVEDVFRIRTTEIPGQATGALYVSGRRRTARVEDDGYFIARLDNNFVDGPPTGAVWSRDISAEPRRASGFEGESHYKAWQPWDVGSDGRVYYGQGAEYDFDWAQIGALDADGRDMVVEHWPVHWSGSGEHRHVAASTVEGVQRSGIVLKAGRGGSLRSHSQADFDAMLDDGNGRTRPGRWPDDVFFSGPCLDNGRDCASGPGHTGYRTSDKPTQRLGGFVIDRRNNRMFFGYSTQSRLPGGNPDFEPAVVAMDEDGELMWWSRLYEEEGVSTPDQYVDGLAIDYATDRLVVLARTHGNNVINFWDGNEVAAVPGARGFQNRFTGTEGNIHISWLGKFDLTDGTYMAGTYVAEMTESLSGSVQLFGEENPLLAGQPNPNAGWANLNTTRCRSDLQVGLDGAVTVMCTGRRTITTSDAWQSMPARGEGAGTWNDFVRTYAPDLASIRYSSLLTGDWDRVSGQGGGNTHLQSAVLLPGGVVVVGWNDVDDGGQPVGVPMPVSESVPAWGDEEPSGQSAIFAHLAFSE